MGQRGNVLLACWTLRIVYLVLDMYAKFRSNHVAKSRSWHYTIARRSQTRVVPMYTIYVKEDEGQTHCQVNESVRSALHSETCVILPSQLRLVEQKCSTQYVRRCEVILGTRTLRAYPRVPGTWYRFICSSSYRAFPKTKRERRERNTTKRKQRRF